VTQAIGSASFHVSLPGGVRQGVGRWYLLRLKGVFVVARRGAQSQISVSVNGRAALQLIVSLSPARRRAPPAPVINELDLVQGEVILPVLRRQVSIDESNYAQLEGLHGGDNTITVKEEGFGSTPLVSSVGVLPGTGLYETALGPSTLSIRAPTSVQVLVGKTARLPLTLVDSGDDARHVRLNVLSESSIAKINGAARAYVGTVSHRAPRKIEFTVRGTRVGLDTVTLSALSNASQPEAAVRVVVYRNARPTAAVLAASALLLLPAAAFLVLALRRPQH
jgi:hypothetical protein